MNARPGSPLLRLRMLLRLGRAWFRAEPAGHGMVGAADSLTVSRPWKHTVQKPP
jgi:hypothetical protein